MITQPSPFPPIAPLNRGIYETIDPKTGDHYLTHHVDLRIIPTIAWLGGAGLLYWSWAAALVWTAALLFASTSIWPLSGGPLIPLFRRRVE